MSITASATFHSFKVKFVTSEGNEFWAVIDEGAKFYDRVSSSGTPEGKPVIKSVDDILTWIGDEGDKKAFKDRIAVAKVRSKKS